MSRFRLYGSVIGTPVSPSNTSATGVYDISAAASYTSSNLWVGTTPISSGTTLAQFTGLTAVNGTGGTITYSGNYKIHTYTGSGTFTPSFSGNIELLLVAGGGGSSTGTSVTYQLFTSGAGAGAGGLLYYGNEQSNKVANGSPIAVTAGVTYTITVGSGGAAGSATAGGATVGQNSSFVGGAHNLIAYGGGSGQYRRYAVAVQPSKDGGSGGGENPGSDGTGPIGEGTSGQGNRGGTFGITGSYRVCTGGGGGAGGVGGNGYGEITDLGGTGSVSVSSYKSTGTSGTAYFWGGGTGGVGAVYSISGTRTYYAGGGGGYGMGKSSTYDTNGQGGAGGGGPSGLKTGTYAVNGDGSPNTGGGAGGCGSSSSTVGFAGGSGICILRYLAT